MRHFLLIISLFTLVHSQGHQEFRCQYEFFDNHYSCHPMHVNITSETVPLFFPSQHLPGMTNNDVTMIRRTFFSVIEVFHPQILQQFPNTQIVSLGAVRMNRFAMNSFDNCQLSELHLGNNDFRSIPNGMFRNCRNLRVLDMVGTPIQDVHADIFIDIEKLEILNLMNWWNSRMHVRSDAFNALSNLRSLSLSVSSISLEPGSLNHMNQLRTFELTFSPMISFERVNGLIGELTNLTAITLNNNNYAAVDIQYFRRFPNLQTLRLDSNQLSNIQIGSFIGFGNLRVLSLNGNQLASLPSGFFVGLSNLHELWLNNNNFTTFETISFAGLMDLRILSLSNNPIAEIPSSAFIGLQELRELHLSNIINSTLALGMFNHFLNIEVLNLHNSGIDSLQPRVFSFLVNLNHLILNNNNIRQLNSNAFVANHRLQRISINRNRIEKIERGFFNQIPSLKQFDGFGNVCINQLVNITNVADEINAIFNECFENWDNPITTTAETTTTVDATTEGTTSTTPDSGIIIKSSIGLIIGFIGVLRVIL